jgi:anti-sigma factor RsiW
MTDLTHERCSELLEAYASGGLDPRARREVDDHLATCSDCSLELVAVQTLQASDVLPLSGAEREQLSAAVRAAVFPAPRRSLLERFGPRLAPALGAVALVTIAAVVLVSLPDRPGPSITSADRGSRGGDTDDAQTIESDEDAQTLEAEAGAVPGAQPAQEERVMSDDGGDGSTEASGQSADTLAGRSAALNARSNFAVQEATFAQTGLDLGSLVPARSPRRGRGAFAYAADLASLAPDERVARLVQECAEQTISTSPHPLVATSAAYYPDDVLVIGFVWREVSRSLLHYELRGWVGGDCDRISPIYRRGVLE